MKDIISYFEFFQLLLSLFKKLYRGVLSNFYITAFFKCPFTLLVVVSRVFTNSFVLLLLAEEVMNREFLLLKIYLISQCFFFQFSRCLPRHYSFFLIIYSVSLFKVTSFNTFFSSFFMNSKI